jgi:hypothetical protein
MEEITAVRWMISARAGMVVIQSGEGGGGGSI